MAQRVKDLAVKTREYTDKEGNRKANWQKIGVVMENDDGKQFMLIDRWVNLGAIPDFSSQPNPTAVMVTMFDINKQSNYQPKKQIGDPSSKGQDNLDEFPF